MENYFHQQVNHPLSFQPFQTPMILRENFPHSLTRNNSGNLKFSQQVVLKEDNSTHDQEIHKKCMNELSKENLNDKLWVRRKRRSISSFDTNTSNIASKEKEFDFPISGPQSPLHPHYKLPKENHNSSLTVSPRVTGVPVRSNFHPLHPVSPSQTSVCIERGALLDWGKRQKMKYGEEHVDYEKIYDEVKEEIKIKNRELLGKEAEKIMEICREFELKNLNKQLSPQKFENHLISPVKCDRAMTNLIPYQFPDKSTKLPNQFKEVSFTTMRPEVSSESFTHVSPKINSFSFNNTSQLAQPEFKKSLKKVYFEENIVSYSYAPIVPEPQKLSKNDFEIGPKLGSGNFAEVFLVRHKISGFICAMKIMKKKQLREDKYENQISREVTIQYYLHHPNVVDLYACFDDFLHVYLLMEFCPDGQLYGAIKKETRMDLISTAKIVNGIAEGTDYIHREMVIHRDLKPENVFMSFGVPKIGDFGWAVYQGRDGGLRKTVSGSPLYFSPELVQKEEYNEKIDVWSIGTICYECLIGMVPFKVYSLMNLNRIVNDELNFPSYVEIGEEAKDFIEKCLKKKAEERASIEVVLKHPFLKLSK